MKKKITALFICISMVVSILVPTQMTFATDPNEQTKYLHLNPSAGDITKGWIGGGNTVTLSDGKLTLVPNNVELMYYGPASEYGGPGSSRILNGVLSFKQSITYKPNATDWAGIIAFRAKGVNVTWDPACEEFYIMQYPQATVLYKKLAGGAPTVLDTINKGVISGKEYSYRISYINGTNGNCNILVNIKDANGNILCNDGSTNDYTFKADNVDGINDAGFVTYMENPGSMASCTFAKGDFDAPTVPINYVNLNPYAGSEWKGWFGGSNNITIVDNKVTLVPNGLSQMFYIPASEYGTGKVLNGVLSFKHSTTYKAGAGDWGSIFAFRAKGVNPTWDPACEQFFIMQYPTLTKLCKKLTNGASMDLAVINKPLVNGAEYSYRISYVNDPNNNCDILVHIKDSNGNIYREDGSTNDYSFKVDAVEGINNAGYITFLENGAQVENYTFSKGAQETPINDSIYNFSNIFANNWYVSPGNATDGNSLNIKNLESGGITQFRLRSNGIDLDNGIKNAEYNFRLKMKYKQSVTGEDWGALFGFTVSDPTTNSVPWDTQGKDGYYLQMSKSSNTMKKSTYSDTVTTLFSPNQIDTSNLIDDNSFHDLKISVGEDLVDNRLTVITISIDNEEVFNITDSRVLKSGGLYILVNNNNMDIFELNSKAQISDFGFNSLSPTIQGTISNTNITATVPYGTNLNNLVATFKASLDSSVTVNGVDQISGVTANDFTNPVVYTVTNSQGSTTNFTVVVTVGLPVQEEFGLSSVFADNMVLQRNSVVNIWGTGISDSEITASIAGKSASTTAVSGKFSISLSDLPVGGPYTLTVTDNESTITHNNVMVGDVWVLAGQSNMELRVGSLENQSYIDNANYPNIRQFIQDRAYSATPKDNVINGRWDVCSPQVVSNFSAVGYFFGKTLYNDDPNVPIGLVYTPYGGTPARSWMPRASTDKLGITNDPINNPWEVANGTYNAMINPILPFTPKGVVWYQGEGQPTNYGAYLTEIISSWRQGFSNSQLPFVVIQLPRFGTVNTDGWSIVREYEENVTKNIPNTVLSVNIDCGDASNIHPLDKEPIGVRAANAALAKFYGVSGSLLSPVVRNTTISGNKIIIDFANTGDGLELRNGSVGFEICGSDNVYRPAQVTIVSSSRIEITSTQVLSPVFARYAWGDFPQISLYNNEGYPAAPFRTSVAFGSYKTSGAKLMTNVSPNLTADLFKDGLILRDNTTVILTANDGITVRSGSDSVGTGTIVNVYVGGTLSESYKMIIYGDVTGDGAISINDLVSIRNHLLESEQIGETFKPAGDLYGEGGITLNDLVGIMAFISESGNINQNI